MKKNLLMAGLALLTLASCMKEAPEGGDGQGGSSSNTYVCPLTLTDSKIWSADAAVGVFTDSDLNVKFSLAEGAGTTTATFKGTITKESTPLGAYIPYNENAGEDMCAVPFDIPQTVAQGDDLQLARFQISAGNFEFLDKLATLKVTFRNVEGSLYEGEALSAITITSPRKITGVFNANLTSPSTILAQTYQSASAIEMTFPSGTVFNKDIVAYASVADYIKAGDKLSVTLMIGGNALTADVIMSKRTTEGEEYAIEIDATLFDPKLELLWAYGAYSGDNALLRPQGNVPAIDNAGNVYVVTNGYNGVLKINADGTKAWSVDAAFNGTCLFSPSIEADGSVVYVGGGKENAPFVRALNASDGSTKWTFDASKFFNKDGAAPTPNLERRIFPAITDKAILVGSGGNIGTVVSIDKATGNRLSYIANADGTNGPGGGCSVGVGITKKGYATWNASWGAYSAKVSELDAPVKTHAITGNYTMWTTAYKVSGVTYNVNVPDALACLTVDGVDNYAYMIYKGSDLYLVCASAEGEPTSPGAAAPRITYKFAGAKMQDQGGIVIGPNNEIIVSLKHNSTVPGGVYAINPSTGALAWKYLTGSDVGGAAAVDNSGNIHVMSDDGKYHIIKPNADGTVKTLLSKPMLEILKSSDSHKHTAAEVGSWSSPMIGQDGKIYAYIPVYSTLGDGKSRYGVVMCMQYASCTAPGNTAWPMKGADARHSGHQK